MYVYFQELFDVSSKQTSKIDILLGEIRSSGEEKITHVCVCVWKGTLFPQINITEQCESLCTRQIIFENPPEPTLGIYNGTECSVTC